MPRKKIPVFFDPVLDPFLGKVFTDSAKENLEYQKIMDAILAKQNKFLNEIDLSDPEMGRLIADLNKPDSELDKLMDATLAEQNKFLNEIDLRLPKDTEIDFSLPADQFDFSCSTDEAIDIIAASNSLAETEMF